MKAPFFVIISLLMTSFASALTVGQKDTFTNGTTQGWSEGAASPNPPTNVATGGPAGAGDRYLQNVSGGGAGAGSKMLMFNNAQWTGDYTIAGVTRIEADIANLGATVLNMRIGLRSGADEYASTNAFTLPADGRWYHVGFDINAASMSQIEGTNTLAKVLGAVDQARILSNSIPDFDGEAIAGTVGADNITALPEPATLAMFALVGVCCPARLRFSRIARL